MFTEVRCVVSGHVQRVAYRAYVERAAHQHNIMGWVKNSAEGTVDVLAQGFPDDLKAFIEDLHAGSVLARVDSVGVDWRTPTELFDDFTVTFST